MVDLILPSTISYSQVNTFQRCPMCWAERYTGEKRDDVGIGDMSALYFGHSVGPALQQLSRGQVDDWEQTYSKTWAGFNDKLHKAGYGGLGVSFERGIALIQSYIDEGILYGEPEATFSIDLPGLPAITGRMDVEGRDFVGEFKTSMARWDQQRVDSELQGSLYWLAYERRNGRRPDCIVYVIFPTVGVPESRRYRTTRTPSQILDAIGEVREAYDGMLSGTYKGVCGVHRGLGMEGAVVVPSKVEAKARKQKPLPPRLIGVEDEENGQEW